LGPAFSLPIGEKIELHPGEEIEQNWLLKNEDNPVDDEGMYSRRLTQVTIFIDVTLKYLLVFA